MHEKVNTVICVATIEMGSFLLTFKKDIIASGLPLRHLSFRWRDNSLKQLKTDGVFIAIVFGQSNTRYNSPLCQREIARVVSTS